MGQSVTVINFFTWLHHQTGRESSIELAISRAVAEVLQSCLEVESTTTTTTTTPSPEFGVSRIWRWTSVWIVAASSTNLVFDHCPSGDCRLLVLEKGYQTEWLDRSIGNWGGISQDITGVFGDFGQESVG